jgi:hypothetical protein
MVFGFDVSFLESGMHAVREVDPPDVRVTKSSVVNCAIFALLASNCAQQQWNPFLLSSEETRLAATCERNASSKASYQKHSLIFPAPLAQFTTTCPKNLLSVSKSKDKKHIYISRSK